MTRRSRSGGSVRSSRSSIRSSRISADEVEQAIYDSDTPTILVSDEDSQETPQAVPGAGSSGSSRNNTAEHLGQVRSQWYMDNASILAFANKKTENADGKDGAEKDHTKRSSSASQK